MKKIIGFGMIVMMMLSSIVALAQGKVDDDRMDRDIEVAENILSTMIRQKFGRRNFMPMEVSGSYVPGFGVTFRMPTGGPFNMFLFNSDDEPRIYMRNGDNGSFSYSISSSGSFDDECEDCELEQQTRQKINKANQLAQQQAERDQQLLEQSERQAQQEAKRAKQFLKESEQQEAELAAARAREEGRTAPRRIRGAVAPRAPEVIRDSTSKNIDQRFLEVAKDFLADYGDVISQLKPDERIVITNRTEDFHGDFNFGWARSEGRNSLVSAEAKREDVNQLKQGKLTRDQFMARLKVVNTETSDELDPDLEVLSSMFGRLYREDLSKTYFTQGDVNYERLKDFGVIYYMRVFSTNEEGGNFFTLPTVGARHLSQKDRDARVKELYPKFESELKENIIEYGRTLRSLKDDEQLVFNVKLTKCTGCAIPSTLEVTIKNSALRDYSTGKSTKEATLAKLSVKKTGVQ
ncbi:MAG: hypothetical protein K2U26_13900 [Cyclobacteriaceae bacterium]|nr:hypothetical protein [Cyclobacteriaceae bacterium]